MMKYRGRGVETQAVGKELKPSLCKRLPFDVKYICSCSIVAQMELRNNHKVLMSDSRQRHSYIIIMYL